jgi:exopolysaccharide biosynthesis protein
MYMTDKVPFPFSLRLDGVLAVRSKKPHAEQILEGIRRRSLALGPAGVVPA